MKKFIKKMVALLFVRFANNHESKIEKAKQLAKKACETLEQAKVEAEKAEVIFDNTLHEMQQELIKLNEKFGKTVHERNLVKSELKKIKELEVAKED